MPEVISDTSPIQYLHQTGLLDLLPTLYSQIIVPQAGVNELLEGQAQGVDLPDPASLGWMNIRPIQATVLLPPLPGLGLGEQEAIALTVLSPDALLVLDDALARRYARDLGVSFTGTLGVLLKAKQLGFLESIAPVLNQLEALRFRLAPATRAAVLKLANEAG